MIVRLSIEVGIFIPVFRPSLSSDLTSLGNIEKQSFTDINDKSKCDFFKQISE
jgi:hypothetical protein